MSYLYITEYDACLTIKDGNLQIKSEEQNKVLPFEQVEGILVYGNASLSKECARVLLQEGIPVTFLSKSGKFFGRLESTKHINIVRQRLQFQKGEDKAFCLGLAKIILEAKVNNRIVVLRRFNRHRNSEAVEDAVKRIIYLKNKIPYADELDVLLGFEGSCARLCFSAISNLLPEEFKFKGRSKMPPLDPFNSLISLGYTMLMYETYTAVVNRGLHPYAGFIHKDRTSHPALASDLIEEWRAPISDSLALTLLTSSGLKSEDFSVEPENGGVFLTQEALKKYIHFFEGKLSTKSKYIENIEYHMSFRETVMHQAGALAKAIEAGDPTLYEPLRLR